MKILIISQYFYPENFRINDIVKELVKRGHVVTVVTGRPNYPEGQIFPGFEDSYKTITNFFGASVYRCKLKPRSKGTLGLVKNYLSFIRQSKKVLKRISPDFDVVFFYEPSPIFSGIPAIWYAKKHHLRSVIYNLDLWPDSVRESKNGKIMSTSNPIYLFSRIFSRYVYSNFDFILNKCDEFGDYLNKHFSINYKKMANLFDYAEDVYLTVKDRPLENGFCDFFFLGNIGHAQNCDVLIKAFSLVDREKAFLHFVGDGSSLNYMKELVANLRLENKVVFHGKKTVEETIDLYNMADVCLLSLTDKTGSGLTPPGKLFSYMAAGRTIVASASGSTKKIIEDNECGYCSNPDDIKGLAFIMQKCIDNKSDLVKKGFAARRCFLNHFSSSIFFDRLISFLSNEHEPVE